MTFCFSVSQYRESIVTSAILVSWDLVSRYIVVSSVSPNTSRVCIVQCCATQQTK